MQIKEVRLAAPIQKDSIVDGAGIRSVIWFQGCNHNCYGCHNPETHDFNGGILYNIDDIKNEIRGLESQSGITFSGGDPFFQPEAFLELVKVTKECGMNVWAYTGYTYEQLGELAKKNAIIAELLQYIDVLVDGKFILKLRSLECKFRGSSNQRLIDMNKTREKKEIVLYE